MTKEAVAWWTKTLKTMTGTASWKDSCEKQQWVDAYADPAAFKAFLADEYKTYEGLMRDLGLLKL